LPVYGNGFRAYLLGTVPPMASASSPMPAARSRRRSPLTTLRTEASDRPAAPDVVEQLLVGEVAPRPPGQVGQEPEGERAAQEAGPSAEVDREQFFIDHQPGVLPRGRGPRR
jgi:hypothetical protein